MLEAGNHSWGVAVKTERKVAADVVGDDVGEDVVMARMWCWWWRWDTGRFTWVS